MHAEVSGKEGLREKLVPYGPSATDRKIIDKLGEYRAELFTAMLKFVNPEAKELNLLYFSCGSDVAHPWVATKFTTATFIDKRPMATEIVGQIKGINGDHITTSPSGNKKEIEFELEGKVRKITSIRAHITDDTINKLPIEKGGYDVYFEKASESLSGVKVMAAPIRWLKIGGHYISDSEFPDYLLPLLGLEEIKLDKKFYNYTIDSFNMHLYHKTEDKPMLEEILHFNELFSNVAEIRNGAFHGISEKEQEYRVPIKGTIRVIKTIPFEYSLKVYEEKLSELKQVFDSLPETSKKLLEPIIINTLYKSAGDMPKVLNSPENLESQLERFRARRNLTPETEERYTKKIKEARESPDRPTAEQLEKFIEEGKKVFKEVFPDWV